MSFSPPSLGLFVNFTAAERKPLLVPSGYFSPNDSVAFIWTISSTPGAVPVPYELNGTKNGINTVFTTPVIISNAVVIFKNGVYQNPVAPITAYTVSGGNTITFVTPPESGDDLGALVS